MNNNISLLLSGILTLSIADLTLANDEEYKEEKCYCIAKAGQNNCGPTARHSCAGQSTVDFDCNDWKYVASDSCLEVGGSLTAGKKPNS